MADFQIRDCGAVWLISAITNGAQAFLNDYTQDNPSLWRKLASARNSVATGGKSAQTFIDAMRHDPRFVTVLNGRTLKVYA